MIARHAGRTRGLVLSLAAFWVPVGAQGQLLKSEIVACSEIESAVQRLDCYDSLARTLTVDDPEPTPPTVIPKMDWQVSTKANPADSTRSIEFTLKASTVRPTTGSDVHLVARCQENVVTVHIDWGRPRSGNVRVTTQSDSEPARTQVWDSSPGAEATFYPGNDREFLLRLLGVEELLVHVYDGAEETAIFTPAGLERSISPFLEDCLERRQ